MGEAKPEDGTIHLSPKPVFGMALPGRRLLRRATTNGHPLQETLFANRTAKRAKRPAPVLPTEDNTPEGLRALLEANAHYRQTAWPEPYSRTSHRLHLGDARDLSWIP